MTDRPTAEERARAIINNGEYLFAIDQIRQAEAAAVKREREACYKDVCSGCLLEQELLRPDDTYLIWRHREEGGATTLCHADAIRSRGDSE